LVPGEGKVTINGRDMEEYFGLKTLELIVRQPLNLTDTVDKYDVIASVCKVMSSELEATVEEESRAQWAQKSESIRHDNIAATEVTDTDLSTDDTETEQYNQ